MEVHTIIWVIVEHSEEECRQWHSKLSGNSMFALSGFEICDASQ